jgi:hypothetical protein
MRSGSMADRLSLSRSWLRRVRKLCRGAECNNNSRHKDDQAPPIHH